MMDNADKFEGKVVEMNRKQGYRPLGVTIPQYIVEAMGLKKGDMVVVNIR